MLSFYLVAFLSRTSIIYGAFAVIPLLMTWIQLSCLFILSGAELSFAIENNEDFDYERDLKHISRRYKDYVTLFLTWLIVRRFERGENPQTAVEMARQNRLPARLVNQLLGRLAEVEVIRETYVEGEEEPTYLPAFDINQLTVGNVIARIDKQGNELFLNQPTEESQQFWQIYLNLRNSNTDISNILVKDMMQSSATQLYPPHNTTRNSRCTSVRVLLAMPLLSIHSLPYIVSLTRRYTANCLIICHRIFKYMRTPVPYTAGADKPYNTSFS
jgi:hypothetical protein